MLQNEPSDYLLKLDIASIGLLSETAFAAPAPLIDSTVQTVCFWFYDNRKNGIRIIANCGNKIVAQPGWTVYLDATALVFRVNFDGRRGREFSYSLPARDCWHHFAGIMDVAKKAFTAYCNGSDRDWQERSPRELVEPGSVALDEQLIIGGYTDAAGGHFNYRFGSSGPGFVDDFRLYARALSKPELGTFIHSGEALVQARFAVDCGDCIAPVTVRFDAGSSLANDAVIAYLWDFGDGARTQGMAPDHRFAYAGRYPVRLRVITRCHAQATAEQVVHLKGCNNPLQRRAVFENGTEGYACYRIPSIVRALNGDLIAFAEGRVADCSDATQVIHIVCKRSSDNGKTWYPLQVVVRNAIAGREYACMNPAPVVDYYHGTGKIIVVYNKMEHSEWAISSGKGICRVYCIFSNDHGKSWLDETDITLQVHKPYNPAYTDVYADAARSENRSADWRKQVPTLGHAIQLHGTPQNPSTAGRLFFIGCYTQGDDRVFYTRNYAFWSDDLGLSWQIGGVICIREDGSSAKGLGEACAVELASGSVMINSRNYQNGQVVGNRAVTIGVFDDRGYIHFKPAYHDAALIDSGVEASLIRVHENGDNALLFANPDHLSARIRMTVRASYDEGKTWPVSRLIDPGPSAYSDLVSNADGTIGLLYELGNHGGIAYVSFALDWLSA